MIFLTSCPCLAAWHVPVRHTPDGRFPEGELFGNAEYRTVLEQTHRKYFDRLNATEGTPHYQQLEIALDDQAGESLPATTP